MSDRILPKEIVSLVHHVALNERGWWEKGLKRIISAVLWLEGPLSKEEISVRILSEYSIEVSALKLTKIIDELVREGIFINLNNGRYKISDRSIGDFEKEVDELESLEIAAFDKFSCQIIELISEEKRRDFWDKFKQDFLFPFVEELGAKTYEFINGQRDGIENLSSLSRFLGEMPEINEQKLKNAIIKFLDPSDSKIRSFIIFYLNAFFFVESGRLSESSIAVISETSSINRDIKVFVDTNVVFSILNFHDNPHGETVKTILEIIEGLNGRINFKFYVTSLTIDETKKSLNIKKNQLSQINFSQNIVSVLSDRSEIIGVARAFGEARLSSPGISVNEFLGPYLENLVRILRSKKVEFYNDARVDSYTMNQVVIDAINVQHEFEQRVKPEKAKSYEKLKHDISLWQFIFDLRPLSIESPIEAGHWFLTLDYGLLAYDSFKQKSRTNKIPVCIHPSEFLRLLQFWVPRTEAFEKAIIQNLQLPFFDQNFDPESENISLSILRTISMYEGFDSLPPEVINRIIVDKSLRAAIKNDQDVEEQVQLVRNSFIEDNLRLSSENNQARNQILQLTEELSDVGSQRDQARGLLEEVGDNLTSLTNRSLVRDSEADLLAEQLQASSASLERREEQILEKNKFYKKISNIIGNIFCVIFTMILLVGIYYSSSFILKRWDFIEPAYFILTLFIIGLCLIWGEIKFTPIRSFISDYFYKKLKIE